MDAEAPSYLKPLADRGITLTPEPTSLGADFAWPHKLSCIKGIQWAHNTACRVANELVQFIPPEHRYILAWTVRNYEEITDSQMAEWVKGASEKRPPKRSAT